MLVSSHMLPPNILTIYHQAKKVVNYAETDDEGDDDEDTFKPVRARSSKRRRRSLEAQSDEDAFVEEAEDVMMEDDEGWYLLAPILVKASTHQMIGQTLTTSSLPMIHPKI